MTIDAPDAPPQPLPIKPSGRRGGFAVLVAAGILLSRLAGLVRESVSAHYLGNSMASGAFKAAIKIPNFLQNLFGEGVLSASFIPVYSRLLVGEDRKLAGRVAGAFASLLALVVTVLVLLGVLFTPFLIDVIAPGYQGEARDLTIRIVRILFPGTGLLVLSAWCLGVLNSHHKFFLAYVAPVLWNAAMIATLFIFGERSSQNSLVIALAWGSVAGAALQLGIQLPFVFRYASGLKFKPDTTLAPIRQIFRNFGPVFIGRGVVQISGFVDQIIASLLGPTAVSGLAYAQTIYMLPVSLFGMAVAASELPQMSQAGGTDDERAAVLRRRLEAGLRQVAFFVIPTMIAFILIGRPLVAAIFESGDFGKGDTTFVWFILIGSSIGLLAATMGRLYSSAFYALFDTKTPMKFALTRIVIAAALGLLLAFPLRQAMVSFAAQTLHVGLPDIEEAPVSIGAAALSLAAAIAGWVEFLMLRRSMDRRIGTTRLPRSFTGQVWLAALLAGIASALLAPFALGWISGAGRMSNIIRAVMLCAVFGVVYFSVASLSGLPEVRSLANRFRRRT